MVAAVNNLAAKGHVDEGLDIVRRPLGIGEGPLRDMDVLPAQKQIAAEAEPCLLGVLDGLRE